jgi:GNAT superfamily N-acetyltransferase
MTASTPEIEIRFATPAEAPTIASILRESFATYEPSYTPEAYATTTPTADQITARFHEGPTWVALLGNTIAGTVAAAPRPTGLYIRSMAVLPTAQGYNIGTLLLQEIERYARQHNHTRLYLSTTPYLARAIRLYERHGFHRTNDGPHDLFGTPLFTMEKHLEHTSVV